MRHFYPQDGFASFSRPVEGSTTLTSMDDETEPSTMLRPVLLTFATAPA
jgi:hypothetical protein